MLNGIANCCRDGHFPNAYPHKSKNPITMPDDRIFAETTGLFPLIFEILIWLIYALNIIPNGNFELVVLPIISFIKIFVAEKVAKLLAE